MPLFRMPQAPQSFRGRQERENQMQHEIPRTEAFYEIRKLCKQGDLILESVETSTAAVQRCHPRNKEGFPSGTSPKTSVMAQGQPNTTEISLPGLWLLVCS